MTLNAKVTWAVTRLGYANPFCAGSLMPAWRALRPVGPCDMGKPYDSELRQLSDTLDWGAAVEISALRQSLKMAAAWPLVAVGSGGSLTAAHFLVDVHRRYAGQVAAVATPLEAARFNNRTVAMWLLSAGGSNVDILNAFSSTLRQEPKQLVVMCGRRASRLASLAQQHNARVEYVDAEGPAGKDGFLATNSLLAFTLLIGRACSEIYGDSELDVAQLRRIASGTDERWSDWLDRAKPLWRRDTLIVLCGNATRSAAVDLESKFTEAALGHVQIADYRNFAHGRHHWLAKRGDSSAVIAFTTGEDRDLAEKTLRLLPRTVPILKIDLPGHFLETSILSLLIALRLAGAAGTARGIDPGRPGVPEFGRRLFSLRARRRPPLASEADVHQDVIAAIERKSGVSWSEMTRRGDLNAWQEALTAFKDRINGCAYAAAVLDYDGTLVDSKDRFTPPRADIARELCRLLQEGFIVGVATGRGPSVRRDLQVRIPTDLRRNVVIGYYNGAEVSTLDDENVPDNGDTLSPELEAIGAAIGAHPELRAVAKQTGRRYQITLEQVAHVPEDRLWDLANQLVQATNSSGVSVVRSSHSIDILAPSVSKLAVLDRIRNMRANQVGDILTIGDRGRWPGNDYVLLRGPHSLSVDEVSVDPSTCWNLSPRGSGGSEATLVHLRALRKVRGKRLWRYVRARAEK